MNHLFRFLFLILVAVLMIKCETQIVEPEPEPEPLWGNVVVTPVEVEYGDSSKITWSSNAEMVFLNEEKVSIVNDFKFLTNLTEDMDWKVVFKKFGFQDITKSGTIKVGEKPPTKLDTMLNLFCDKGWKLDNVTDYTLDGDSIGYWPLNEFDKSDIYYFYRDYSRAVDRTVRGKGWSKTEPNNWKFTQDCTHIAVDVYKHNYDERRIILNDSIYKKIIPNYAVDVNGVRTPINTIETYKL